MSASSIGPGSAGTASTSGGHAHGSSRARGPRVSTIPAACTPGRQAGAALAAADGSFPRSAKNRAGRMFGKVDRSDRTDERLAGRACRHCVSGGPGPPRARCGADSVIAWELPAVTAASGPGRRPHWKGAGKTGRPAADRAALLAVWGEFPAIRWCNRAMERGRQAGCCEPGLAVPATRWCGRGAGRRWPGGLFLR